MNRYAYVLTTQLLQQQVGSAALAAVLEMAKATKPDEDGIANLIEAWMVTVGGVKFHAGLNLASIAKTSLDNARTGKRPAGSSTELQVRRVSYPRPLSRLLRDLEGGRAIAIVLSGVGSVAVAAWCIVDTNPAAAPESYVRDRASLVESFPYFARGSAASDRGEQIGTAKLLVEGFDEPPKAADIVQIFRTLSHSGWSAGPRPADLNRHLSDTLWGVLAPYLESEGVEVLIGGMLHAIDLENVAKVGRLQPGWSFYSSHGFRPTGVLKTHPWTSPDGRTTCKLTYELMLAPLGGLRLNTPWGEPATLTVPDAPGGAKAAGGSSRRRVPARQG